MVNLLPRTDSREPFPVLDPEQCARFELRLRKLASASSSPDFLRRLERSLGTLEVALDELESEASLATALDLLERIEAARSETSTEAGDRDARNEDLASSSRPPNGELICYWPGRSLSTGEADVASRGFFDVLDRPPIGFWIEAVARPTDSTRVKFEIAIIAWIPAEDVARADAGRRACKSGALAMLGETSEALAAQLRPILTDRSG
jgi:hypothetical protein